MPRNVVTYCTSTRMGWATLAAVVATLTRPDGVLVAAVVYAFHLLQHGREGWRAWRWPVVYALVGVALVGFRLAYYGSAVPNTFFAKVGGIPVERGFDYIFDFLRGGAGVLLVPAVVAVARDRRWWPGATFCVVLAVYVVAVGGDVFPHGRFLLPALPCHQEPQRVFMKLLNCVMEIKVFTWEKVFKKLFTM